jgi:hypothetical protein
MQVHCRCGQGFTIADATFPHRIGCHACGRHFLVLDSGEAFELDAKMKHIDLSAFQARLMHTLQKTPTTEICTEETRDHLDDVARTKQRCELAAIDLLWTIEREGFNLLPFSGWQIMPSRSLALGIGLATAIVWLFLWGLFAGIGVVTNDFGLLCNSAFAVPTVIGPTYIFKQAREFEAAERAWIDRRFALVKKWY